MARHCSCASASNFWRLKLGNTRGFRIAHSGVSASEPMSSRVASPHQPTRLWRQRLRASVTIATSSVSSGDAAGSSAQRITLTLGPNGRWRSRATYLASQGQPAAPQTEQGCWNVTGEHPAHLLLLDAKRNPQTELVASADNVLSIKSIRGRTPLLPYTLTRQPDLDPIDEQSKQPLPDCP